MITFSLRTMAANRGVGYPDAVLQHKPHLMPLGLMRRSKGFTLAELLVGLVVMGIIGMSLTQILISDSRFVEKAEAMLNARQSARAAMNILAAELEMVGKGGLTAASPTDITVRAPYALGILCDPSGGRLASLLPSDSMAYASATADGLAWRSDSTTYTFMTVSNVVAAPASDLHHCTDEGISILPDGQAIKMTVTSDTMPIGAAFYLYQTIRYRFYASVDLPGRVGLWRTQGSSPAEEILAPFDAGANFAFFVGTSATPQAAPPVNLSTVTGLELNLIGSSEVTPLGSSQPPSFEVSTRVNFLNNQ